MDDTTLAQLIKRTTNKPNLLPEVPKVVVSLFDGSGTIWQILSRTGLMPEYAFSAEADPYQVALLGARYGYRNPPTWLKEAAPEQNGYENPNGLIHLGSIFEGGMFEHDGQMYTCQQMIDLHTGVKDTPVTLFVGGPVCSSNSGLNRDTRYTDKLADDATSNLAGDFYVEAAKTVRAVNPDVKMVVENIRNSNANANKYNRKVMEAFGATAIDYFNNIIDKKGREKANPSDELGLEYRLKQWLDINTPEDAPMNRVRSIWANYRLPNEEYDAVVKDMQKERAELRDLEGKPEIRPDNPFTDSWAPIRGGRLGTITGNSGIDTDQLSELQGHISTMDSIGTILAKHDPNGEYIITEDGRPGIIKSRASKLTKKVRENTEVVNDPTYGEILVWAGKESKDSDTIRRPELPRTQLQKNEPYIVRYPSIEEGKKLMWDDETLADVPPEVDKYLMKHTHELYPDFMLYDKKGKQKAQKHNKKAARHAQGISWHTPTFEKVILGILRSNQKIDPDFGMSEGGYVEKPKNKLALHLKSLGHWS